MPPERHELFAGLGRVLEILAPVKRDGRAELFLGKGLTFDPVHLGDEHLGVGRHFDAGQFGNLGSGLADHLGIEMAFGEDGLAHRTHFVAGQNAAAMAGQALAHHVIDRIDRDHRLFGGADHAVVEGLGHQNGGDGALDVGMFVDQYRGIAGRRRRWPACRWNRRP